MWRGTSGQPLVFLSREKSATTQDRKREIDKGKAGERYGRGKKKLTMIERGRKKKVQITVAYQERWSGGKRR